MDLNSRMTLAFGKSEIDPEKLKQLKSQEGDLSELKSHFVGLMSKTSEMKDGHVFRTNEDEGLPPFHFRIKWNVCKFSKEKSLVIESSPNPTFVPKLVSQGKLFFQLTNMLKQWKNQKEERIKSSQENSPVKLENDEVVAMCKEEIVNELIQEVKEKESPVKDEFDVMNSFSRLLRANTHTSQKKEVSLLIDKIDPGFLPPRTLIKSLFSNVTLFSSEFSRVLSGLNYELQRLGVTAENNSFLLSLSPSEKNSMVTIPNGYAYSETYIAKELLAFIVSWCKMELVGRNIQPNDVRKLLLLDKDNVYHSRIVLSYELLSRKVRIESFVKITEDSLKFKEFILFLNSRLNDHCTDTLNYLWKSDDPGEIAFSIQSILEVTNSLEFDFSMDYKLDVNEVERRMMLSFLLLNCID